ncbi:replication protein A 70 kDa DNA-binding subunit B-like [Solanum tuberosum]|uniref:replication protein A 70 kDa DNA-binding subunit B-like n=1 Tax=Solanum tuberosum TaxID=4113 RepID=UPI00073A062B|nr:PREDICTED: replication protein A 70 kDa DNA-binding subunit B-like [Solanum tuberosum]
MATESELAKQSVPINKIPKNSIDSVIRVLVIRRGSITPYKNSRNEGTYRTIILVDEEYSSVHKEVELAFTDNTVIKETIHEVSTQKFSDGFLSLDAADNLHNGSILGNYPNVKVVIFMLHYVSAIANLHEKFPNLICILVSVNPIIQNATSKRRDIVVTKELMEPTTVTLWGDFAENDGAFLDKLKDDKPILGLCDVRVSIYKGRFGISTIPVSSVLINPIFQKAIDLRAWHEIIEAHNKDIIVAPTKAMRRAIEVPLDHILDGLLAESEKEECHYYRKLVLSKDKQFNFLVRIDLTDANPRRSLIAEEINQLEDEAPIILEEEVRSVRKYRKRAKKTTNAEAQINQKKPKAAKD